MTPFEDLVDKLDTFIRARMGIIWVADDNLAEDPLAFAEKRVTAAKKSLVAAVDTCISESKRQFYGYPTSLSPTPPVAPDPDRWAKAACAESKRQSSIYCAWNDCTEKAKENWRLLADAVRNVKP